MKPIRLMTYRYGSTLPPLPEDSLPNSSELFEVYGQTPGYAPILVVASIDGNPIAKLQAVIRLAENTLNSGKGAFLSYGSAGNIQTGYQHTFFTGKTHIMTSFLIDIL